MKTTRLMIIALIILLSSCMANKSAVPYHQGLQREATFANRLDNVEAFTVKSAKDDNSRLKQAWKSQKKQNNENAKRKAIEEKNAELRKKIEESKNN